MKTFMMHFAPFQGCAALKKVMQLDNIEFLQQTRMKVKPYENGAT